MADERRDPEQRPSPEALLEAARREEGRAAGCKIFLGAAPGVGKTYEMLKTARARLSGRRTTSSSASSRRTGARRPRRCSRASRSSRASDDRLQGPVARRDGPRRHPRAAAAARAGRRAGAHQRARQPPSQALPRRRGTAGRRHRRLHDPQHPAHREPERRGGADHPHPRARDGARLHLRPRRRRRAGRPHARRSDPAAEGGQGLRPEAGRARARALLLACQPDGAARAGAAPHRRARRRAAARPTCRRTPSPARGRPASACSSASARTRARRASCATPSGSPTACTRRGPRSTSRRRRSLQLTEEERDRIADTLRLAQSARRRSRHTSRQRRAHRRRRARLRARATTSPRSSSANRRARAGSRSCTARSCTTSCGGAGNISVHVIAGDEVAGEPIPKKTSSTAAAAEAVRSAPLRAWRWLAVAVALGVGKMLEPLARHREHRSRLPHGRRRRRSPLRPVAVAVRQRRRGARATISFSLPPLSTPSPSPIRRTSSPSSSSRWWRSSSPTSPRACACRRWQRWPGPDDRIALCLQPQARRRGHARRCALGDRLSDRADAQGARRPAAARGRRARVKAGYPPEDTSTRPISPRPSGPGRTTGRPGAADTLPGAKRLFLPMRTGRGAVGVVGIDSDKPGPLLTPDQRRLLDALIDQGALAIERVHWSRTSTGRGATPRPSACARRCSPRSRTT